MKAIVTGSNGFIGYNLCRELERQHWRVAAIDDLSSGRAENEVEGFHYHYFGIENKEKVEAVLADFEPDVIFHLAAIPRVSYSVENPFATATANIMGTLSLLEALLTTGLIERVRFVNSGSSSVYGGAAQMPTPESHPCRPQSPYALQKLQAEEWIRMFVELYGLDGVTLRYFNVFGPHALFGGPYSTVLSAWLYHLYVDPDYEPFLEGDGTQTRDFCYVDNVVQALLLAAARSEPFGGEAYNIAQGEAHSLLKCKELLERIAGRSLPLAQRPPRIGDVKHTLADISAAQEHLGYHPDADFEEQLRLTAAWYREGYPTVATSA